MPTSLETRPIEISPPLISSAHEKSNSVEGFFNLFKLRTLITMLVKREFEGRYKGSILDALWPILNPLGHMILYTFLFSIILQVRFGESASTSNFALYLMCGFLPWTAMAESISSATTKILEMPNLVKRVVFPLEVLPLVVSISAFISGSIAVAMLCILASVYIQTVHWTILLLPLVFIPHFLFTTGISWFIASLGVFIRDSKHFVALGLSAWMYATPIVYPADRVPENLQWILVINPASGMITDYRRLILEGNLPDFNSMAVYATLSLIIFLFGFHFFYKTKSSFADVM